MSVAGAAGVALTASALTLLAVGVAGRAWRRRRPGARGEPPPRERDNRLLRLVFDNARDAIFVTAADGRILDANPACLDLFALDATELPRRNARDFWTDIEDRDRLLERLGDEGTVTDREVVLRDSTGRRFPALLSATARMDEDGKLAGLHGVVRDVSARKVAEARLRASEERFRLTMEHAPIGIALVELDGTFTQANPAFCRILGYSIDELRTTTFQELTHPDHLAQDLDHVDAMLRGTMDAYETRKRYHRRDGSTVWVHLIASLVRDADGEPLHFVAHIHDITGQVVARRELQSSERRFRSLIENGSELIAVLDGDGVIRYQSPAFRRILGYEEGDLEGTEALDLVHEDDRDRAWRAFATLAERRGGRTRSEYRIRHADGRWRTVEARTTDLRKDPGVGGIVVNARDVTERRSAEDRVARSQARLQAILDTITEAVVLVGADGRIEYANRAAEAVLGVTPVDATRRTFDDPRWKITTVDGGLLPEDQLPFVRVMATGEPVRDARHAIERPDGEQRILSINAAPLEKSGAHPTGMVASIQDITERTRAEEEVQRLNRELEARVRRRTAELAAANEELEAFAYSVSHDLRAPLRALDGFSQALVEDHGDRLDGEARHFLGRIQANSRRMARLIDDILALSRVSRRELERTEVDLAALARDALRELQEADPDRSVSFVAPERLPARGDPGLLRTALDNLLGNAWKFTRPQETARIELGVDARNGGRTYFVRDNGVGFEMAYVDRLFQPFHRLHDEDDFQGTGIGLATVSRIVRRHGGTVSAQGAPDEGATIRFSLGEGAR